MATYQWYCSSITDPSESQSAVYYFNPRDCKYNPYFKKWLFLNRYSDRTYTGAATHYISDDGITWTTPLEINNWTKYSSGPNQIWFDPWFTMFSTSYSGQNDLFSDPSCEVVDWVKHTPYGDGEGLVFGGNFAAFYMQVRTVLYSFVSRLIIITTTQTCSKLGFMTQLLNKI